MMILAIYGSPNEKGNSATITDAITKGAESAGHFVEKFFLYDLKISGCTDCENAEKILSAPRAMQSTASGGVAMPPAAKLGTGSLPCSCT